MKRRLGHGRAVLEPQPRVEASRALAKAQEAGAAGEALEPVGREPAGAAVAEPDAVKLALEVVDVIVPDERPEDVALLDEGGEEAAVESGGADGFMPVPVADRALPHLGVLRKGDVSPGGRGRRRVPRSARRGSAGRSCPHRSTRPDRPP